MTRKAFIALTMLAAAAGCMPRVSVKPNPGPDTKGIRYYRPKPYLLITPYAAGVPTPAGDAEEPEKPKKGADDENAATPKPEKAKTQPQEVKIVGLTDQYVQMELKMLPDFSEEYAIDIRTGFGTNHTQITLEDGWNLTSVNAELDSKTAENITAVAQLLSSIGGLVPGKSFTGDRGGGDCNGKPVVRATNVPLGFYESIIGRDSCGKKQLFGWRYVGFAPFNGCPMQMCGSENVPCGAVELYGLAFEDGIMTFKRLKTLAALDQAGNYRYLEEVSITNPCPSPNPCPLPAANEFIGESQVVEEPVPAGVLVQ
jgi:hypothetical protein